MQYRSLAAKNRYRYQEISARLTAQIDAGAYLPGERLPSVRDLMQQENISLTTAVRVLRVLEENGRAYSHHRSGFFVRPRRSNATPTTADHSLIHQSAEVLLDGMPVRVNHLVVNMLESSAAVQVLPLGSAVLDCSLVPQSQFSRVLATIAKREAGQTTGYIPPPGLFDLRCDIARLMGTRGVLCGPDDVIITAGDTAFIECALRLVAHQMGNVAIETPTYFGFLQAIEAAGMKAVEIATHPATGIDIDQLERVIQSHHITCVLLNPTLQNPLGCTIPIAHRKRIAEMLSKAQIPLIEDDVFHDLCFQHEQIKSIKSFDQDGGIFYCSSFSKILAPGYRVGWCLPGRYHRQIMNDAYGRNISISSLPQRVLSEFLRRNYYGQHIAKLQATLSQYPMKMEALIDKYFPSGTWISKPKGGFVYWIKLPSSIDMAALYSAALANGFSISPGSIFFASGMSNESFRICIGRQWTTKVEQAIVNLGKLCCKHVRLGPNRPSNKV